MRSIHFYLLLAPLLLGASPLPPVPPDDLDVPSELQQKQKELADLPVLPAAPLRKAVFFRLEDKNLCLYTSLFPTSGVSKIKITDLPGLCTADVRIMTSSTQPASIPYQPDIFSFVQTVYDLPASTVRSTTVNLTPMNLQVAYNSESPTGLHAITLIQTPPGIDIDEPPVRLTVDVPGNPHMVLTAPDFLTLRRQYPGETTKYLEPVFRGLHADGIAFSPDPKVAWQVFAADAHPDPAIAATVNQIIPRLDSDNFKDRESAAADLKKLGQPGAVVLWKINRAPLSTEQNSRIDTFLADYQPVTTQDADRLGNDVMFLLQCLYNTDDFLVTAALMHLEKIAHRPLPFDRALRDEARRDAVNNLRESLLPPTTQAADPH